MVKARLTLLNRKNPIKTGYRPLFLINNEYYTGIIFFDGGNIFPNEQREVRIEFVSFSGKLTYGDKIRIFESPKNEIGNALII